MTHRAVELVTTGRDSLSNRPDRRSGLVRVRRGVYADTVAWANCAAWERYRARIEAFRLTYPTAILSHESAACALELPTFGDPVRIHVAHMPGHQVPFADDVTVHRSEFPRQIVQTDLGLTVSPIQTAIDLARTQCRALSLAVWDATLRVGVALEELIEEWRVQPSRRNVRALEWLSERATALAESPGESISRALAEFFGYPKPELQVELVTEEGVARADLYWRQIGLVGEFDGYGKYELASDSVWKSLRREKRREDALRRAGYSVVRWEHRDLQQADRFGVRLRQAGLIPTSKRHPAQIAAYAQAVATLNTLR